MAIVLNLGVIEAQYKDGQTTGLVARVLEKNYGLFSKFGEVKRNKIVEALAQSMVDNLEARLKGDPVPANSYEEATDEIRQMFMQFIDTREAEHVGLGPEPVPTAAATKGVNHRLTHPYSKKNPSRPSFLDTGLLQTSFRAWVDETED